MASVSGRNVSGARRAADADKTVGVPALVAAVVLVATTGAGYLGVRLTMPLVHNRYLPWIAGRTFGMAAYGAMFLLVLVGLWMHHPWRTRWTAIHPEALLRLHAALGAAVVVLLAGHVTSLALDRYAGVGWSGVFVPGASVYRPWPVAAGVCAAYGLLLVSLTAGIGGRLVGRAWRPVHLLSLPVFAAVWCHGLLAGSDGMRLRVLYAVTGALVLALALTRLLAASTTRPELGVAGRAPRDARR
jgi:sulfoxide reductase heme-binding subunit YedZ